MGDNQLSILIQAKIDEASTKTMQDQLTQLAKNLKSVKISLDLGDVKAQFAKMFQEIEKESQKANPAKAMTGKTSGITSPDLTRVIEQAGKLETRMDAVREAVKSMGELTGLREEFSSVDGKLVKMTASVKDFDGTVQTIKNINVFGKFNEETQQMEYQLGKVKVQAKDLGDVLNLATAGSGAGYEKLYNSLLQFIQGGQNATKVANDLHDAIYYKNGNQKPFFQKLDASVQNEYLTALQQARAKEAEMDKIHYQALQMNKQQDIAKMDALHKEALAMNKAYDNQKKAEAKTAEAIDKAHYLALQEEARRNTAKMDAIHAEALKENERRNKEAQALDKAHREALAMNAKMDIKQSTQQANVDFFKKQMNQGINNLLATSNVDPTRLDAFRASMEQLDGKTQNVAQRMKELKAEFKDIASNSVQFTTASANMGLLEKEIISTTEQFRLGEIEIQDYANKLKELMFDSQGNLSNAFKNNVDVNAQIQYLNTYRNIQAQIKQEEQQQSLLLQQKQTFYKQIEEQLKKIENITSKNSKYDANQYSSLVTGYNNLKNAVENGNMTLSEARSRFQELGIGLREFQQETRNANATSGKFFNTLKMMVGIYSLYDVLNLGKRAITSMISEVKTLDSALVELNKVSDLSREELDGYVDTAFKVSEAVGRLGSDVINATSDFVQMGYNISEASELAKNALMYVNVGDLGSVDDATATMISTMKAFGVEADNSLEIIDKINNVSNHFAISAEGIGAGLQRASSALSTANNDINETLALMAVGNQVVQDPESLANGLKTISMRLRGLSEDGEVLDSNMEELFNTYANGVKVLNDDGTFKSTFEILRDLGQEWDKLSDKTQALLGEKIAGKNRANIFFALMQNAQDLDKALTTAQNSAGSAMEENARFMDSIEGKTQQLKTAWQSLSSSVVNSDLVKGVLDTLTGFVKLVSDFELLRVAVIALTTALTGLAIVKIHGLFQTLVTMIPTAIGYLNTMGMVISSVTAGTLSFGNALVALNLNPVMLAITGVTTAVTFFAMQSSKAKKEARELAEANRQLADEGQQAVDSIQSITNSYNDLYDPLTKTITDKEKLVEVQEQLRSSFGAEAEGIDLVNGKYDETLAKLNELTQAKLEQNEVFLRDAYEQAKTEATESIMGGNKTFVISHKNAGNAMEEIIKEMQDEFANAFKVTQAQGRQLFEIDTTDIKEAEKIWTALVEKMQDRGIDRTNSTYQDAMKTLQGVTTASENLSKAQDDLNNNLAQTAVKTAMTEAGCVDLKNATEEQVKSIQGFVRELQATNPTLASYVQKLLEASNQDFSSFTKANAEALNTYNNAISATENAMASAMNEIEVLDSAISTLTNNQMLSGDVINDLISRYSSLQDSLVKTDKGYTLSKDALVALRNQKVDEANVTAQTQRNNVTNVINGVKSRLTAYKQEVSAIKTLAQAQQALAGAKAKASSTDSELKSLVDGNIQKIQNGTFLGSSASDILKFQTLKNKKEENDKIITEYESLVEGYRTLEELDKIIQGMDINATNSFISSTTPSSSASKKNNSSSKSNKKSYISQELDVLIDDILSSTEKLEYAIEFANEKLTTAQNKGDLETQKAIKDQIVDLIKQRKDETVKQAEKLRAEGENMIKVLSGTGLFKSVDLKNLTEKQLSDVTKILEKKIASSTDSQAEDLEILKAKVEEYGQAIIRIYGEELPTLSKEWWSIHNEYMEKMQESIEDTYNLAKKKIDASNRDIELQQILMEEGSQSYIELEKKKYENVLALQEEARQALIKIKELDKNLEGELAQEYLDLWYDAEKEKREMIKSINQQIMELRQEELEKQIKAMEEYKDSMEEVIDATVELIKHEQKEKKKALQDELDGYKKIIDAKKEALQDEKDDKDYQKELSERQAEITKIENKILELQNDNSLTAKKKRQELEEELIKLKEELTEKQEEHALNNALEALDKEYEAFEETQNSKIEAIDDYLSQEGQLRQDAIKRIENDQQNLYKQLLEWNKKYGTAIDADITDAWNKAMEGMKNYGDGQNKVLETIENIVEKLKEANDEIKYMQENSGFISAEDMVNGSLQNSPNSDATTIKPQGDDYQKLIDEIAPQMNRNSDAWGDADAEEKKRLAEENEKLAKQIGAWKGADGRWYVTKKGYDKPVALKDLYPNYHTGGIVGGEAEAGLKSTEQFAKLLKGEVVSTESQMRQFLNVTYPKMLGITQGNSPTGITIDRFVDITVQGNLDTSVDLENIIKRASQKAIDTLVNTMSNMGIKGLVR